MFLRLPLSRLLGFVLLRMHHQAGIGGRASAMAIAWLGRGPVASPPARQGRARQLWRVSGRAATFSVMARDAAVRVLEDCVAAETSELQKNSASELSEAELAERRRRLDAFAHDVERLRRSVQEARSTDAADAPASQAGGGDSPPDAPRR